MRARGGGTVSLTTKPARALSPAIAPQGRGPTDDDDAGSRDDQDDDEPNYEDAKQRPRTPPPSPQAGDKIAESAGRAREAKI